MFEYAYCWCNNPFKFIPTWEFVLVFCYAYDSICCFSTDPLINFLWLLVASEEGLANYDDLF